MNYWLTQLVLAARNKGEDNVWMQILGFAILAIFYAVGSLIKAKTNKTAQEGKEQIPHKPVRKPPENTVGLQILKQLFGLPEEAESSGGPGPEVSKPQIVKQQVRPTVRKIMRPQPAAGRKTPITVKPQEVLSQVQPKLEKVPGLTGEDALSAEIPQTKYLSEILLDYDDPEKLRRAILHYEILGKPVSLRTSSEHIL